MQDIIKVYYTLDEYFSIQELMDLASDLSRFHRIQGTQELEKAGEYIASILENENYLETEIRWYDYRKVQESFGSIIGWQVEDGELRLIKPHEELLHSFKDSKTLIVAHSPGGEVEAEVIYIGNGNDPSNYERIDIEGKIILTYGDAYLIYKQATAKGASGILVYRESGPYDAVPYMGLLLTQQEAKEAKVPILAISRKNAKRLISMIENGIVPVVRINIKARYRKQAKIPVVSTKIGKGEDELHLCAHYCHPARTVNDNVSGAASLIELALALARAIKSRQLSIPDKHTIRFLWFPEYTGSLAYLSENKHKIILCVNLDMIGEKQELTASTLGFVRPPPRYFHPYEGIFYLTLKRALMRNETVASSRNSLSYRFDAIPYESGSDHDIYLQFGIPSIMINQWPDKFYHTDQDTIDKFDPQLAKIVALSVGTAAYTLSKQGFENEIKMLLKAYLYEYIGQELSLTHEEVYQRRHNYLMKAVGSKILDFIRNKTTEILTKQEKYKNRRPSQNEEKYAYQGPKGVITRRILIRSLDLKTYHELSRLIRREKFLRTLITSLIPLYMHEPISIQQLKQMIEEDYGIKLDIKPLIKIVNILTKAGLIKRLH